MDWVAAPSGRRGRPATFSDAAIQACLMLKALSGLPLRQTTGLGASLLTLAKLDWPVGRTPPVPEVRLARPQIWPAIPLAHHAPTNYH